MEELLKSDIIFNGNFEKNLNFEGLTRKIQMRPLEHKFIEDKFTKKKKSIKK